MRITNSMMVSQFLNDANSSLSRVSKYQNQVDSTKRVTNISDDPQATLTALKARNKLSEIETYQGNIKTATSYLTEAESASNELNDVLQKVYEEVVSATSGTKTQNDLNVYAEELTNLQEETVSIGNTKVSTSYVFAGYNFTGTTDGVSTTAPFSVDETSGHLIYNGIDLSKVSWAEDFTNNTSLMTSYSNTISENSAALGSTSSDAYARDTLCAGAQKALDNLVACGKAALGAATEFGIDPSSSAYQNLSTLIYGVGDKGDSNYVAGLSDLADDLKNECSKELAQDVSDDTNAFSITSAQSILDSINEMISNSSSTAGLDYSMSDAVSGLQGEIDADTDYTGAAAALADEKNNQASLQIGTNQEVDFTFSGTDLLGSGTANVYFIIGKCVSMLNNGDTESLSNMISEIQNAQSNALCFETEIGTTENSMSMISSRYDSSKINYTQMKSDAVDADMAEAITNLTTAKTVYSAALAGGAKIIQTSLIDFLS